MVRTVKVPESAVLKACLELLQHHPKVAMVWRANTGAMKNPAGQYVKFGFTGQPDIMGVLKGSGRFICVETKAPGKQPSIAQASFLISVQIAGGIGYWTDDAAKLAKYLETV